MGKALNLTNQRFGRLVVLYKTNKRDCNGCIYWHCQCDCGNEVDVISASLTRGNTKSCGCLLKDTAKIKGKNKMIDITNKRFGKLIALYPTDKRQDDSVIWHCKCDCGNECDVNGSFLRSGRTSSCGCLMSKGELIISKILRDNNVIFEQQKTFDTCRFIDTNRMGYFDFYLPELNILIEYDGEQHYQSRELGYFTEERFKYIQEHDKYKNQWCKENDIPLIRIPYWHLDDLCFEDLLLKTSKFVVE